MDQGLTARTSEWLDCSLIKKKPDQIVLLKVGYTGDPSHSNKKRPITIFLHLLRWRCRGCKGHGDKKLEEGCNGLSRLEAKIGGGQGPTWLQRHRRRRTIFLVGLKFIFFQVYVAFRKQFRYSLNLLSFLIYYL